MPDYADPFSIRLTKRQIADLTSLSTYDGLSRQELIRRALDMYLEDRRQRLLAMVNNQVRPPAPPVQAQPLVATTPTSPPVATPGADAVASDANRPLKVARR